MPMLLDALSLQGLRAPAEAWPCRLYVHTLHSPRLAEAYCDRLYERALQEGRLQKQASQAPRQGGALQRGGSRALEQPLPRASSAQALARQSSAPSAPQAR